MSRTTIKNKKYYNKKTRSVKPNIKKLNCIPIVNGKTQISINNFFEYF